MSKGGLEPPQISPHAPQACASTVPPLRLIPISILNSLWRLRCCSGSRCAYVRLCTLHPSASLGS